VSSIGAASQVGVIRITLRTRRPARLRYHLFWRARPPREEARPLTFVTFPTCLVPVGLRLETIALLHRILGTSVFISAVQVFPFDYGHAEPSAL